MKTTVSCLMVAGFLMVCTGQSFADTSDVSATLSIDGRVNSSDFVCSVDVSESSVAIIDSPEDLIKQGAKATKPTLVHVSLVDTDPRCEELLSQGKIAYKIRGVADDAAGTVLANTVTDTKSAKGVGIGLFDAANKPVSVNSGRLIALADTILGLQLVQLNGQQPVEGNIYATASIEIERL